jgi:hypothetical protein
MQAWVENLNYLGVHLLIDDKVVARKPIAVPHSLRGGNNVLSHGLRGSKQTLPLTGTQLLIESLGNHTATGVKLVG